MKSCFSSKMLALALCVPAICMGGSSTYAGTLRLLHEFTGGADGALPLTGVTLGADGNLFGEVQVGGEVCGAPTITPAGFGSYGCGVVYEVSPTQGFATLHTFQGPEGALGTGSITISHNRLLGTTNQGVGKGVKDPSAYGTLFSLDLGTDKVDVLASFNYNGKTGALPIEYPRLYNKKIYGVADLGGVRGCGTLYSRDESGAVTILHSFACPSPGYPSTGGSQPSRIFIDRKGVIFGATYLGGPYGGDQGSGVVYSFDTVSNQFKVIYAFRDSQDGANPQLGGIGPDDTLYGEANQGGAYGLGTVFELQPGFIGYQLKLLHVFTGGADGGYPQSPPAVSADGVITGTTSIGGGSPGGSSPFAQGGTIYQIVGRKFSTLFAFTGGEGAYLPYATPTVSPSGVIYGTTYYGGKRFCRTSTGVLISKIGCGAVYSYTP